MTAFQSTGHHFPFVSTFLSHSSTDSALVEKVAQRLGRRGVLAWLDKNELKMGPLDGALKQAIQEQSTLTIFLSEASARSSWCRDELKWAIEAQKGCDYILPVYLGDPGELVRAHDLLRTRFLDYEGKVNQLGYVCEENPSNPDPDAIAEQIAATAYHRSIPEQWSEVVIVLDQRGDGQRRGLPSLPHNINRLSAPVLTFRPRLTPRTKTELLIEADWEDMVNTMTTSLSYALGTQRNDFRNVLVLTNAQTGLVWAVGKHFDRTCNINLYGYDRFGNVVSNKNQERLIPLPGGNPNSAQSANETAKKLNGNQPEIALGVGSQDMYGNDVRNAVSESESELPLFWIESGQIDNSEQAMQLVADIIASVRHLRQNYDVQELILFWTGASHVALLVAANLTRHVIHKIKYMERDHSSGNYIPLPMP